VTASPLGPIGRRRFLTLGAATPALAALLQACGGDSDGASRVAPAGTSTARGDASRAAADPALAPLAATAVNLFGTDLYRQLATAQPTANVVVSPTSIAVALSMAAAGASGTTLAEMIDTLRVDDGDSMHRAMNALDTALVALGTPPTELSIANSMWLQDDLAFEQAFLDTLATEYGAAAELVNFKASPEAARVAINDWVAGRTKDRITDLIPPDAITVDTRLALVNAIYLKAAWLAPFDPEVTTDRPFTTATGDSIQVPTMTRTMEMQYATGDGWVAVELPYADSTLAMLIFLPEDQFLAEFESIFLVSDATQYLAPQRVQLAMPRFDFASALSLPDTLAALGMDTAFTDTADFTGITTDVPLRISAVVHQANITVAEAGTEAAAATAVGAEATSAPVGEPIMVTIDRPFVFAIRDRVTEAVLFLGRVADPR
jgi:serpin B